jgi:hypothetical protein
MVNWTARLLVVAGLALLAHAAYSAAECACPRPLSHIERHKVIRSRHTRIEVACGQTDIGNSPHTNTHTHNDNVKL